GTERAVPACDISPYPSRRGKRGRGAGTAAGAGGSPVRSRSLEEKGRIVAAESEAVTHGGAERHFPSVVRYEVKAPGRALGVGPGGEPQGRRHPPGVERQDGEGRFHRPGGAEQVTGGALSGA